MTNLFITVLAYVIDRVFGEFAFIKHPIIIIGEFISFFENKFYKDTIFRGALLVLFMLLSIGIITLTLQTLLESLPTLLTILLTSIIASMFIAHKMLHDAVLGVLNATDKRHAISMLVSRDTKDMSDSDINKAAIETYAENLSDGVIAPLFYLLLFGLVGVVLYKVINTMDSMVGYRNDKYENYGKVAAILDDIVNFIPSRLTAIFIMVLGKEKKLFAFYKDGKKHDSPNAGHPITAMALVLNIKLGGDTSYFGKIKKKSTFGEGRTLIKDDDVKKATCIFYTLYFNKTI
ncbi:cobalamin biosynthesis protein CobD [Sulfurimonas sp. SAG-AH-194-C21]|nr:adenosylcobinamide-phosphate synthase CbiB [Sulfurimonas sp. SAG-AH-194-C21]MDF1883984.1 cobalamin biosynthesis protein CobD [Sulfurimonas sp. SAG-AH-194-C21]